MEALSTYGNAAMSEKPLPFAVYDNDGRRSEPAPRSSSIDRGSNTGRDARITARHRPYPGVGRAFDMAIALVAILIFLPFLILAMVAIKLSAPGPALFIQPRVGRDGRLFPCLKFRTMVVNSQEVLQDLLASSPDARLEWERDQKLRKDPRITPIGAILRKSSLDELPQLFNILVGHMSVVGPRPIVEAEIKRYGNRFAAYCSVRPGLTGLWQVSGRNEVSYETRVRLDALYALRKSTIYDLAICLRTVPAVIGSRGVY
ncbi:sugar transferase [Novosphingobium resinovorum]|uniref:sugar transferase n=1 Tax=Novosphingobium resinovorum TaxID=158500 RepID=UPI002ED1EBC6|nr:sugar transferase [Novosphingobium resinovorum]